MSARAIAQESTEILAELAGAATPDEIESARLVVVAAFAGRGSERHLGRRELEELLRAVLVRERRRARRESAQAPPAPADR